MPKKRHLVAGSLPAALEERALNLHSPPMWITLSSVTLNKSLNFAKPQISHLRNGYNITSEESKNYII